MAKSKPAGENPPSDRLKAILILVLAWTAGMVDAVGFLNLAHLFTTHMSGNSAATGAYLGQGNWREMSRRVFPIPLFVVGVASGGWLTEVAIVRRARSVFLLPLLLEEAVLAAYLIAGIFAGPAGGGPMFYVLAALPSFAMGVQNATLKRVGHRTVRTTYVTGMLTNFADGIVAYIFWRLEQARGQADSEHSIVPKPESLGHAFLFGGIWLLFVLGAGFASWLDTRWRYYTLLLPIGGVLFVLVFDLFRPLYTKPS